MMWEGRDQATVVHDVLLTMLFEHLESTSFEIHELILMVALGAVSRRFVGESNMPVCHMAHARRPKLHHPTDRP